jgi:hypothetical protein
VTRPKCHTLIFLASVVFHWRSPCAIYFLFKSTQKLSFGVFRKQYLNAQQTLQIYREGDKNQIHHRVWLLYSSQLPYFSLKIWIKYVRRWIFHIAMSWNDLVYFNTWSDKIDTTCKHYYSQLMCGAWPLFEGVLLHLNNSIAPGTSFEKGLSSARLFSQWPTLLMYVIEWHHLIFCHKKVSIRQRRARCGGHITPRVFCCLDNPPRLAKTQCVIFPKRGRRKTRARHPK